MRPRILLPVLGMLYLSAGCAEEPFEGQGVISGREYDDPDTWIEPGYTEHYGCFDWGLNMKGELTYEWRSNACSRWVPDQQRHDGPHWYLEVDDAEGKTHRVTVGQETYDRCNNGWAFDTKTLECNPR